MKILLSKSYSKIKSSVMYKVRAGLAIVAKAANDRGPAFVEPPRQDQKMSSFFIRVV